MGYIFYIAAPFCKLNPAPGFKYLLNFVSSFVFVVVVFVSNTLPKSDRLDIWFGVIIIFGFFV